MSGNGTLADRNNNPLNIRTSNDNWQGARGENGGFVDFTHPIIADHSISARNNA